MKNIGCTANDGRIKVYAYGTDAFKSESLSVYFSVPAVKEKSVARALLLSVLKRGTQKYPTQRDINERLDEIYASLISFKNQKYDDVQLIGVSADVIDGIYTEGEGDLLREALEVVGEMLFHPRLDESHGGFCEEYVDSEKENYKSIILSQINEPRTYAAIRCREEMFSELGNVDKLDTMCERIDATGGDELLSCYREMICEAPITAFYVGTRDAEEVLALVREILPSTDFSPLPASNKEIRRLTDRAEPARFEEKSDVSQARLVIGYSCPVTWRDEDYYAMLLCNEILGASPISKLMTVVREKLSLCYECSSVYNSARGALFVTTGIDRENYELAERAIAEQIDLICEGQISETELNCAKKSIINVYSAVCDSPSAIERFYLGRLVNGIDVDIPTFLENIEKLTASDVAAAAKKLKPHTVYFLSGDGGEAYCE